MDNRRNLTRKQTVAPVSIYSAERKKLIGEGFVTNINEDGVLLLTQEKLKLGAELVVDFRLPNGWRLDFAGKIVHIDEASISSKAYGMKFLPDQATFILKLV
ncbi:MAG TPA: hypothetical protein DEE98_06890 [Elusimicrobia bacterium]|nr:MAG: hypothetical protein A2278_01280 [Elusimicrobia bacterium RIFOXYA12_FULL_49_49]OGS09898.1 MAG: hypothetical protein A2204_07070 [Elusimicrobia bacterium RIFOXYA1_FULL_47_7]OGS15472.1 MAG: hypothetical protein A2251_03015 [Elusimicrobia bacterium RIFOXYA2_FULL_47_53]OGS26967.1 MAG: hypothetical protein A2339_04530 [Elusimicrobia bacterium RIFOXYB12_FULL_50_12]OGS30912.1 MAG: hypothetical protein A2323_00050 [Elusimicrobia bacterium RIFOXYB2_FULL_46_23]HBU70097.1 hypothetical protein [El